MNDKNNGLSDPKPGTLEYAQMVAEKYGDLDDAAVEDGMDPAPNLSERVMMNGCTCRGGPHGGYTCPKCRGGQS